MKRNDIKALHDKTVDELNKLLNELTDQLAKIRLEKSAGKLENTTSVKNLSDDVARVKTVLTIKQASSEKTVAKAVVEPVVTADSKVKVVKKQTGK